MRVLLLEFDTELFNALEIIQAVRLLQLLRVREIVL
jgi:hypothetical protein